MFLKRAPLLRIYFTTFLPVTLNSALIRSYTVDGWMANSEDPDKMPLSGISDLGLHCLFSPVCPNTYGKYGTH